MTNQNFKVLNYKNSLFYSILGLLFGLVFGIGIIFSISGLVASFKLNKNSVTRKWAMVLAIIGIIVNLAFIVCLLIYILI